MGMIEAVGLGLQALPGLMQIGESRRRREHPPQVGRPSGTREGTLEFIGGLQPSGGFQIDPFVRERIMGLEEQPETIRGGVLGLQRVPNPEFGNVRSIQEIISPGGPLSQSEVQDLAAQLRAAGQEDLASSIVFQAGQQAGGTPVDLGVRELIQAGMSDVEQAQEMSARDWARNLQGLATLQGVRNITPMLQEQTGRRYFEALREERVSENRAIQNLQRGRLEAILPLAQAGQLRREMLERFDPEQGAVMEIESQREAMDMAHKQQEEELRASMTNNPAFAGQPGLMENQMRNLKFAQRKETADFMNGVRADYDRMLADIDLQSGAMVENAAAATAGDLVAIRQNEAQANDVFQTRRTQLNLSRIQNDMSIGLLERSDRYAEADYLRTMSELFVPEADLVRQAFTVNLMLEDRMLAFEQGTFQQAIGGVATIGSAVQNFMAGKQVQEAGEGGSSFSAGGAATGAVSGAASGAAMGSVVPGIGTAVGAIAGGIIGAAGGGLQ